MLLFISPIILVPTNEITIVVISLDSRRYAFIIGGQGVYIFQYSTGYIHERKYLRGR